MVVNTFKLDSPNLSTFGSYASVLPESTDWEAREKRQTEQQGETMDIIDSTLADFAENDLKELWDSDYYAVSHTTEVSISTTKIICITTVVLIPHSVEPWSSV